LAIIKKRTEKIMSWKPDELYEGLLVEFLRSLLEDYYPDTGIITRAQNWLIDQLKLKKGPFAIRHAKDLRDIVGRKGVVKPRYYFSNDFQELNVGFDIIASDNESTSSFYSLLLEDHKDFSNKTMKEMLQTKIFSGILRKQNTPQIELDAFSENEIKSGMNDSKLRPALSGLKLCHILDAGKNIENKVSENQLLERAFRCLNPINIFPFPNNKYIHYLDGLQYSDLGEENEIQELFAALIQLHFFKSDDSDVKESINIYYQYLNKEVPSVKSCEAIVAKSKDKIVKIEVVKSVGARVEKLASPNVSVANTQQRKELSSQTRLKFNALEIRPLADNQVVCFQIDADADRYQADAREIHGVFTCRVADIKTFFDWENDIDWNNNNTHSWSRFPNWANRYFIGQLGNEQI
jgi:hypothetical protein